MPLEVRPQDLRTDIQSWGEEEAYRQLRIWIPLPENRWACCSCWLDEYLLGDYSRPVFYAATL